jgi:hypothetical protein
VYRSEGKPHKIQYVINVSATYSMLADGVGFEPTVSITHAGFQDRCLKPLGHPSITIKSIAC